MSPVSAATLTVGFVAADPASVRPGSVNVTTHAEAFAFLTWRNVPGGASIVCDAAGTAYTGMRAGVAIC